MDRPDIDWECIARALQQKLNQAQRERDELRQFLKWLGDSGKISKGLKAVITEALRGHY